MNPTDSIFHEAISKLLIEVFEGPPGDEAYVLNPGDPGFSGSLKPFPRQPRQPPPTPAKPPIAAHVDHVLYGLSLMNRWTAGEENPWASADWNASWRITSCHRRTVAGITPQAASGGDSMARRLQQRSRTGMGWLQPGQSLRWLTPRIISARSARFWQWPGAKPRLILCDTHRCSMNSEYVIRAISGFG